MRTPFVQILPMLHKVALAGGAAGGLRFLLTQDGGWAPILLVNLLGCALLGVLLVRQRATLALAAGFCGGLTSFSALIVQARASAAGYPLRAFGDDASLALPTGVAGALLVLLLHAGLGAAAFLLARRLTPPPTAGVSPAGLV